MKLTKRNRSVLVVLICFGLVIGTLSWEILERIVAASGRSLDLSVGPIGLDLRVIAVWLRINPGSFVGAGIGVLLFNKL